MKNWHILSVYFLETCKIGTYDGNVAKVGADSFCIISDGNQVMLTGMAKSACASLDATVLKPTSNEMNQSILDVLKHQKYDMSLLSFALVDATDEAKEGTWTDIAGNPLTYTNWFVNQPRVSSDQNFAVLYALDSPGYDGKWSVRGLDDMAILVCQKKLTGKS